MMELYLGGLWFNKHHLNNEEEREFENLRKMLKDWAMRSLHPSLPELSRELKYLEYMQENLDEKEDSMKEEIDKKIDFIRKKYEDEKVYL